VSNPPRLATRPATGFEDREALRDLTTPGDKDTRMRKVKQGELKGKLKIGYPGLLHGNNKDEKGKWECLSWRASQES
jgi:hypothetical protein